MPGEASYTDLNEVKTNFDNLYTSDDPREYFKHLGQLDYIIPHLAKPIFHQLIRARAELQPGPITVLDLGCSYGINGALMKYAVGYDALRQRYTSPGLQTPSSQEMLALDRAFYNAWPRTPGLRVIGLDVSENAVRYAQACGAIDLGLAADLEAREPTPQEAAVLSQVDIIVSTGCVGYVTSKTFQRVVALARRSQRPHQRMPWVVSFVLRMFPYHRIVATLAGLGLKTEQFEGATFVQRRFASREEMEATVQAVEARGLDTAGHEAEGLFHADLFVSRPPADIERQPLHKLISVVSGANKPWAVGTNVLGSHGRLARQRARKGELDRAVRASLC